MAEEKEDRTDRARRPSGEKTSGKKTTGKKPAAKKTSARKTAAKKTAGRSSTAARTNTAGKAEKQRVSAPRAMRYATEQLEQLLGRAPESVSSVKPTDDGWEADVECVEVARVPDTTSVMASYRVTLDEEGELVAYERTRRYTRGQIDPRT